MLFQTSLIAQDTGDKVLMRLNEFRKTMGAKPLPMKLLMKG